TCTGHDGAAVIKPTPAGTTTEPYSHDQISKYGCPTSHQTQPSGSLYRPGRRDDMTTRGGIRSGLVGKLARMTDVRIPSQPWLPQKGVEIQFFGTVRHFPVALPGDVRRRSCQMLNQVLADTQILYALYKKHHWLVRGATFYQLHLLLDKHAGEQLELVDKLA